MGIMTDKTCGEKLQAVIPECLYRESRVSNCSVVVKFGTGFPLTACGNDDMAIKVRKQKGAVLLNVLFFAIFFAVLISKIFSTLHETKASSPKAAGAQIERYVSEAVMTDVLNKCNTIRGSYQQYNLDTPDTTFGNCRNKGTNDPPPVWGSWADDGILVCTKTYTNSDAVPVKIENFKGAAPPRPFGAQAVVTLEDLNKTPNAYQWDCGGVEINSNVQM